MVKEVGKRDFAASRENTTFNELGNSLPHILHEDSTRGYSEGAASLLAPSDTVAGSEGVVEDGSLG
eukprot:754187-Hanusia_phi.AAC.4